MRREGAWEGEALPTKNYPSPLWLRFLGQFRDLNACSDERSAFYRLFGNPWLWGAVALSFALQALVVYLPGLQRAFNTVPLSLSDWLICLVVASSVLWLMEARKLSGWLRRRG
jgi:Ca2+-transporting ATPase